MAARGSQVAKSTATGGQRIAILRTNPDAITLHSIEDKELETLVNITRPYSLALCMLTAGGALGLLPSALDIMSGAGKPLLQKHLILIATFSACVVATVILGCYAGRGLYDAHLAVKRIRERPTSPI
jgi:hypothetical protein